MADYNYSNTDITFTGTGTSDILNFNNDAGGSFDWRNFSFVKDGDSLLVHADNGSTATITNHFLNDTSRVETLSFSDGFTLDLTAANIVYTAEKNPPSSSRDYTFSWGTNSDDLILSGVSEDAYNAAPNSYRTRGLDGNDTIIANYIMEVGGGAGDDTIYSRARLIYAGTGNDIIHITEAVMGTEDNMSVYGDDGDDTIYGTDLKEHNLQGNAGNDTIYGYGGDDSLFGGGGDDTIYGGDGDDHISSDGKHYSSTDAAYIHGNDHIYAGAGNDDIYTGDGIDIVYAGSGDDRVFSNNSINNPGLINDKEIYGEDGNDRIDDGDGDDSIHGGRGNDRIDSIYGGSDVVYGNDGDDVIYTDVLQEYEVDYIYAGLGNDFIQSTTTAVAAQTYLYGGGGNDTYVTHAEGLYTASIGHRTIVDTGGFDTLVLNLNSTDWDLTPSNTDITITLPTAQQTSDPGEIVLKDHFTLNGHIESIEFDDITISLIEILTQNSDTYTADATTSPVGSDNNIIWALNGDDIVHAGIGTDFVYGSFGDDTIHAGAGDDYIFGEIDNDTLYGNEGDDHLFGGGGNDILIAGTGNDFLEGGANDDSYVFNIGDGANTITETSGFDRIVLGAGINAGDLTYTQIGNDLNIDIASGLTIRGFFSGSLNAVVEEIVFDDGSSFNLMSLLPLPKLNFEAENMDLSGSYITSSISVASNKGFVEVNGGSTGTISSEFSGPSGVYNLDIDYFDENDGIASFDLLINGVSQHTWVADQDLGNAGIGTDNLVTETAYNLSINHGDLVELVSTRQGGEAARVDLLSFSALSVNGGELYPVTIEAEDMNRTTGSNDYIIASNGAASGGEMVQINGFSGATLMSNFTGVDGTYSLDISHFDETDGVSSYELRINGVVTHSWLADSTAGDAGPSAQSLMVESITDLTLATGDVIELIAARNSGEPARVDKLVFTPDTPYAVEIEAEDMTLDTGAFNYDVQNISFASGGSYIELAGSSVSGIAATNFTGVDGLYNLNVSYFDENDGAASYSLSVNGVEIHNGDWVAGQDLGNGGIGLDNLVTQTITGLTFQKGDLVELTATRQGGEAARVDTIAFNPAVIAPAAFAFSIEAEDMALDTGAFNYDIQNLSVASGGSFIELAGGSASGIAATDFNGVDGTYDIAVNYFDENDGVASYELRVNGQSVDSWLADQDFGEAGISAANATQHIVQDLHLAFGDTVELYATRQGGEAARVDRFDFTPVSDVAPTAGNDILDGDALANIIDGLAGDDVIHGNFGDDALYGGDGLDTLWGDLGADSFIFDAASAFNDVDEIKDFDASEDIIDISDILDGSYNATTDAIADFVQITDDGTNSFLAVDADGAANGANFVNVARIDGVIGLDPATLELSENLKTIV